MKRKLVTLLLGASLLLSPVYAHAQDSTAEATPPADQPPVENPLPPVEDDLTEEATFLENILRLVSDVTYIPSAAAGVIVFTSVFSMVLFSLGFELTSGQRMLTALAIQVIVWVAYSLLTRAGFGTQFTQWYETIVTIVQALLPLAGSVYLGHRWYESAKISNVPILGFTPKRIPGSKAYNQMVYNASVKSA